LWLQGNRSSDRPTGETSRSIDLAAEHEVKINYILETHRNEDYVIGSAELAAATQAGDLSRPRPDWKYGRILQGGQEFKLGKI